MWIGGYFRYTAGLPWRFILRPSSLPIGPGNSLEAFQRAPKLACRRLEGARMSLQKRQTRLRNQRKNSLWQSVVGDRTGGLLADGFQIVGTAARAIGFSGDVLVRTEQV